MGSVFFWLFIIFLLLMNMIPRTYDAEAFGNFLKQTVIVTMLMSVLWCGKRMSDGAQPEIMRSMEYREDDQDGLYDIEYENDIPYDRDDECIMLSRQESDRVLSNAKKIAFDTLSPKKK